MTQPAPFPLDESERLARLHALAVLDSEAEPVFDALTRLAADICGVPIALISLVDADRQWFKSAQGLSGVTETPRDIAFCSHTILGSGLMEVGDAAADPRFAANPLVTGQPEIRFYAGAPIRLSGGQVMGTLCVIDRQPRVLDERQRHILGELALAAAQALEWREHAFNRVLAARSQIEQELADNLSVLSAMLDGLPVGVGLLDAQLRLVYANRIHESWFGQPVQQLIGTDVSTLQGPQAWEKNRRHFEAALAGQAGSFEMNFRSGAGQSLSLSLQLIPNQRSNGIVVLLTDRTLQRHSENTDALLASIVNHSEEAIISETVDGDVTSWNAAAQRLFGYRPEEIVGRSVRNLYPPEAQAEWARLRSAVTSQVPVLNHQTVRIHKDGTPVPVSVSVSPVRGADGRVIGQAKIVRDIGERLRAERALQDSFDLLRRTGRMASVGGWQFQIDSAALKWTEQTCLIHGRPVDYVPALDEALNYYLPADRAVLETAMAHCLATGTAWDLELQMMTADRRAIWVRAQGALESHEGRPVRLVGAFQDITERKGMEQALAESHEMLRVTLDSIGDAVITTDVTGRVQWLNPVAEHMTGWTRHQAMGLPLVQVFNIVNEETRELTVNPVDICLQQDRIVGLANHTVLISRNGAEFGIEDSAAPIRDRDGRVLGVVLVFHDVSEQRRLSSEMTHRAQHDALTGLVNRGEFELRLQRTLDKALEDGSSHALMYIDLDQFKVVNDACGHTVGDQLLRQITALLQDTIRGRDTLARLGGDEFGVILEGCTVEHALRVAQQICDRMEAFRFMHDGRRFRVGSSIGLVPIDRRWTCTQALLQAADTSCYAAKEAGRNRVHTWFDSDAAMQQRRGEMQWVTRLEQAMDEDGFELFLQRIVPVHPQPQDRLHCEVLLRLRAADGSLILPGSFLVAAERFHMAPRIDRWVLRRVFELMHAVGPGLHQVEMVAINLSGQSIGDRAFHRFAAELVREAGFDVSKLCFEITETAAITNLADASNFMEQMRDLGVKIALDDFGAGASSFGYLKSLPVDLLKIDGQFIRDLVDDPLAGVTVRCFRDVAKVVGVKTVAEFVERDVVLNAVRDIGIDYAQGYLQHRPEPWAAVMEPLMFKLAQLA